MNFKWRKLEAVGCKRLNISKELSGGICYKTT